MLANPIVPTAASMIADAYTGVRMAFCKPIAATAAARQVGPGPRRDLLRAVDRC